jgi:D-sedoheptulose 7-phosphate isomerase
LITAYANDYGYEMWVSNAIESYAVEGDVIVLISSSGRSKNLVNAAIKAKQLGLTVVTFTGFANDNPLKSQGHINFWLESKAYNIIECTHMIWITTVVDMLIGKAEYSVS